LEKKANAIDRNPFFGQKVLILTLSKLLTELGKEHAIQKKVIREQQQKDCCRCKHPH
jgi:hypothetical protein